MEGTLTCFHAFLYFLKYLHNNEECFLMSIKKLCYLPSFQLHIWAIGVLQGTLSIGTSSKLNLVSPTHTEPSPYLLFTRTTKPIFSPFSLVIFGPALGLYHVLPRKASLWLIKSFTLSWWIRGIINLNKPN